MSVIIEDKGANIYFDNQQTAYVWSDEFLFEEVLVNYFNNALNHMDEHKIIRINVEKIEENVRVTVFNSGENIPEDEIDHIWEKFYKVDKARTREYGGSGLGLSIVKAVADSLNKPCGVQNHTDGVAFWIDLESAAGSAEDADDHRISVESAPKRRLTELPIWKKTATTASKILSSTTKIIDKSSSQKHEEESKKRKPKRTKKAKKKTNIMDINLDNLHDNPTEHIKNDSTDKTSEEEITWKKVEENPDASDQ